MTDSFVEELQTVRLLQALPLDDVADLAGRCTPLRLVAGQRIFSQRAVGDALYFLIDGEVEISQTAQDGSQRRLASLQPGVLFGEMSLVTGERRSASATAAMESRALRFSREAFESWISEGHPGAARFLRLLAVVLSQRLVAANERAARLAARAGGDAMAEEIAARELMGIVENPFVMVSPRMSAEGRQSARYPCSLRAGLSGEEAAWPVLDISLDGMKLSGEAGVTAGVTMALDVWDPVQRRQFQCRAEVQWRRDGHPPEFGLRFLEISSPFQAWIQRHVERVAGDRGSGRG